MKQIQKNKYRETKKQTKMHSGSLQIDPPDPCPTDGPTDRQTGRQTLALSAYWPHLQTQPNSTRKPVIMAAESASPSTGSFPASSPFHRTDTPPPPPPPPPPPGEIRTCRICFDQVAPPYAADDELGRLISPCVCKGSSRFVHEGCLQQWRVSAANHTNFYQCPTCNYQYQFRRLKLAAIVGSTGTSPPFVALLGA